ncbi:MAG: membrane protein insertion efficiency factor YidD [Sulfurovum sp.]
MKIIFKYIIRFYQKYLTVLAFGSCRYYPTCSSYAQQQLDNNTFFKAIYFTILRILKCNQLFDGGIDYPVVNFKSLHNLKFKKIKIVYWFVPRNDGKYFVVKNREWNSNNESSQ